MRAGAFAGRCASRAHSDCSAAGDCRCNPRIRSTATLFHPPSSPFLNATRAEAAALALTALIQADTLSSILLPSLGEALERPPAQYPAVGSTQVAIGFEGPSDGVSAEASPAVDSLRVALDAFIQGAAYELNTAQRNLPDLSASAEVRCCLKLQLDPDFLVAYQP